MPVFHEESRRILKYTLKGTAYGEALVGYLALLTQPVSVDDAFADLTEAAWTTYARQLISFAVPDADGNSIKNDAVITFPISTVTNNTIVALVVISTSSSTGALKYYTNLCEPIVFNVGDAPLSWPVGALTIRLGDE
jgi:hypothetical protein